MCYIKLKVRRLTHTDAYSGSIMRTQFSNHAWSSIFVWQQCMKSMTLTLTFFFDLIRDILILTWFRKQSLMKFHHNKNYLLISTYIEQDELKVSGRTLHQGTAENFLQIGFFGWKLPKLKLIIISSLYLSFFNSLEFSFSFFELTIYEVFVYVSKRASKRK